MFYLVANWKAQMSTAEVKTWMATISPPLSTNLSIIVCPSYPELPVAAAYLKERKNIYLGSQDVSRFSEGKYTGEVAASLLPEEVTYTIVGHAERRRYFNETDEDVAEKVKRLIERSIKPIVCVRNEHDKIPIGTSLVVYEPETAIGTGNNEPPASVVAFKKKLNLQPHQLFLYGGDVNATNAPSYLETGEIAGFLVGRASLDPHEFAGLALTIPT